MFRLKKKNALRQKSDTNKSDELMFPAAGSFHDADTDGKDQPYDHNSHNVSTPSRPILSTQRSKGSRMRRKKSPKDHEDIARSRALEMSIDFENNATEEYLSLNTEGNVTETKSKSKRNIMKRNKNKSNNAPTQGSKYPSLFRKSPKNSKLPVSHEQYLTSPSHTDNESVFSNPFEDDSCAGDESSIGSFRSAVSTIVSEKSVSSRGTSPKNNSHPEWHHLSKDYSKVNPFDDDGQSSVYTDFNDDSSFASHNSVHSQASIKTMPTPSNRYSNAIRNHSVQKRAVYGGNSYQPKMADRLHDYPSSDKLSPYQYPSSGNMQAYAPRSSMYNNMPSTQEAALLQQARHYLNSSNNISGNQSGYHTDQSDYSSSRRPKLPQVSDNLTLTPDTVTKRKGSGKGLRSKLFSRKNKSPNLNPPSLM